MDDAASYDEIAEWYDEQLRSGSLIHDLVVPTLLGLVGDISGRQVCDLACGQGVVARQLAERGAVVTGIDLSARLLAIARREEAAQPRGISYLRGDAQELTNVGDASFDGVVCNMALMDIPDLAATARTVARLLRPHGWFAFSITHPVLDTALARTGVVRAATGGARRQVRTYFAEGLWRSDNPHGVRGKVGAYHRTLSTYVNTLVDAGLNVERLAEPQATGTLAERLPHLRDVPGGLVARCRKR